MSLEQEQEVETQIKNLQEELGKLQRQSREEKRAMWKTFKPTYEYRVVKKLFKKLPVYYRGEPLDYSVYIERKIDDKSTIEYERLTEVTGYSAKKTWNEWHGMEYGVKNNRIVCLIGGGHEIVRLEAAFWGGHTENEEERKAAEEEFIQQMVKQKNFIARIETWLENRAPNSEAILVFGE